MSEPLSLDTRHRDGGNYIADDEVHPTTVWFANGRKVSIEHTEVKNEIEGGDAYLQIERELHPAFAAMKPATTTDNKTAQMGPVLSDVKTAASVSDAELELLTYLRSSRTITISDPLAAHLFCGETGLTQEQTIRVVERLRKWRVKHDD